MVNPPTPEGKPVKRAYWVAEPTEKEPEAWLKEATQTPDSWWPDWVDWLKTKHPETKEAPKTLGSSQYKPLCPAPGTYVKE